MAKGISSNERKLEPLNTSLKKLNESENGFCYSSSSFLT
jgi:hypothetical protein